MLYKPNEFSDSRVLDVQKVLCEMASASFLLKGKNSPLRGGGEGIQPPPLGAYRGKETADCLCIDVYEAQAKYFYFYPTEC